MASTRWRTPVSSSAMAVASVRSRKMATAPTILSSSPDGHSVRQGGLASRDVLEMNVVFRLSGGEQAGQKGFWIELLQRLAQHVGELLCVEQAQPRGIDIDHSRIFVDGDDAPPSRVSRMSSRWWNICRKASGS